jgi:pimeloyl-ACP methyl ester carboxylesterase
MATLERIESTPASEGQARPDGLVAIRSLTGEARIGGEHISVTYREAANKDDITDPTPLLIAHGWGGPEEAYKALGEEVAMRGKPSITYGEGRSLGVVGDLNPLNLLRVTKLASKAAWAAVRHVRDELGHETADAYGHSWGGQTAINLAVYKPEVVRAVVLDGSCGLDEHGLPVMIYRTGQFFTRELVPALGKLARSPGPRAGLDAVHYMARHPGRSLAEGISAGTTDLHPRIEKLMRQGIPVAAIQSSNDAYFPLDRVESHSHHLFGEHFYTREDPESNHIAPQLDPVGTAVMVLNALHLQRQAERPVPIVPMAEAA